MLACGPQLLPLHVQVSDCLRVRTIELEEVFSLLGEALDLRVSRDEHGCFVALTRDNDPGNVVGARLTAKGLLKFALLVLPVLEGLHITDDEGLEFLLGLQRQDLEAVGVDGLVAPEQVPLHEIVRLRHLI